MSLVRSATLAAVALCQVAVSTTRAQLAPLGGQFQVNSYTTSFQGGPAVAADGAGNFVVAWVSGEGAGSDTAYTSIQAQRYDSAGVPLGSQFQVNSYTTGFQSGVAVAAGGAGGFVVTWQSDGSAGSDTGPTSIQAQRYDGAGAPLGSQFQVNSYTTGAQDSPAVAADAAGNFVVAWRSDGSTGSDSDSLSIQAQRYDGAGAPLGTQFQVNSYTTSGQDTPAVAADGAGNFVVTWRSDGSAGSDTAYTSIQARWYDSTGAPLGTQFQVNSYTTSGQDTPAVAADGAGNFVVTWQSYGSAGSDDDDGSIQARRYDSTGAPLGPQFQVNSYTREEQLFPAVAADGAGNFVVTWESRRSAGSDASGTSVQAQRYDSTGAPFGPQFEVNSYTTGHQSQAAVAAAGAASFVATWQSYGSAGSDASDASVQAQRYDLPALPTTALLPGRIVIVEPGALAKFLAKPISHGSFNVALTNPIAVGGSLRVFDTLGTAGDDTYALPGTGWKGLGNPAGSKGWKYTGAGSPTDPCKVVLVRQKVVKGVCKGSGIMLAPAFDGEVGIILSIGTNDRYCASFGGDELTNDATLTKRKNAPAPGACP